jgi:hypothetical protein
MAGLYQAPGNIQMGYSFETRPLVHVAPLQRGVAWVLHTVNYIPETSGEGLFMFYDTVTSSTMPRIPSC